MIVYRRSTFGYDPCVFELRLKYPQCLDRIQLQDLVARWYADRQSRCSCSLSLALCLAKGRQRFHYQLVCERMCATCVPEFVDYLYQAIGDDVIELALGSPSTEINQRHTSGPSTLFAVPIL